MKTYGKTIKDDFGCNWGCCDGKYNKHRNARKRMDRVLRSKARQTAKKDIKNQRFFVNAVYQ